MPTDQDRENIPGFLLCSGTRIQRALLCIKIGSTVGIEANWLSETGTDQTLIPDSKLARFISDCAVGQGEVPL